MRVHIHSSIGTLRRSMSFSTSALIHGALLAYVAFGTVWQHADGTRQSLYDQQIRPHEKKIIWYHVEKALPEIRPRNRAAAPQPLRATRKFSQEIVAGARDDRRPPQLVWAPAPEMAAPKLQALPNVVAVEQRALTKAFTPPAPKSAPLTTPSLPDAPKAAAVLPDSKLPIEADRPKALVREFQRPALKTAALTLPALPDAPQVAGKVEGAAPAIPGAGLKPLVKQFTPPSAPARRMDAGAAPELPNVAGPPSAVPQLAIVGLDPAKLATIPPAPPSHDAGFSAGPNPRAEGAATDGAGAELSVPGLTVRGGARESNQPSVVPRIEPPSRKALLAGVRAAAPPPGAPPATHMPAAPDPILQGRVVYSIALQMPNVTSYSGSWIVWFAEREPAPGGGAVDMHAPSPLRKVDPKYVASAAADRVEGTVRLSAVIRKNGRVDTVALLRHLDDRLDASAMEALAKWEFEPARRNGAPVDVDAVFEIPFHLAPRPPK